MLNTDAKQNPLWRMCHEEMCHAESGFWMSLWSRLLVWPKEQWDMQAWSLKGFIGREWVTLFDRWLLQSFWFFARLHSFKTIILLSFDCMRKEGMRKSCRRCSHNSKQAKFPICSYWKYTCALLSEKWRFKALELLCSERFQPSVKQ